MSSYRVRAVSTLEQFALSLVLLAVVAMLSFPVARGVSETFGWLPFWLLGCPLSAWAVACWRYQLAAAGAPRSQLCASRRAATYGAQRPRASATWAHPGTA
jgi:hypothetical protein